MFSKRYPVFRYRLAFYTFPFLFLFPLLFASCSSHPLRSPSSGDSPPTSSLKQDSRQDSRQNFREVSVTEKGKIKILQELYPSEKSIGKTIDSYYLQEKATYYFTLGLLHSQNRQHQRAFKTFQEMIIYAPESMYPYMHMGVEALNLNLLPTSLKYIQLAMKKNPKHFELRLLLTSIQVAMGDYQRADKGLKTLLREKPKDEKALFFYALLLIEQKKQKQAMIYFNKLADSMDEKEEDSSYLPHYYLGKLWLELKDKNEKERLKKGIFHFKKSIEKNRGFIQGYLDLAMLYKEKLKQTQKAIELLESHYLEKGAHPDILELLSQYYFEEKQYVKSYAKLKLIELERKNDLLLKFKLGLILVKMSQFKEATQKFREVLSLAPDSDKVHFYLGLCYEKTGRFQDAITHFGKIVKKSPFFVDGAISTAYIRWEQNQKEKALQGLEETLELYPDVLNVYLVYTSFLNLLERHDKAIALLTQANRNFPNEAKIYFLMGSLYEQQGNLSLSIKNMRQALTLNPDYVEALNYLAYIYAEKKTRLKEAESMARKALNKEPENGYILDTLGWVFFQQGHLKKAKYYLQKAYAKQPREVAIIEHLGDLYHKTNRLQEAKKMYEDALKITKNLYKVELSKKGQKIQIPKGTRSPSGRKEGAISRKKQTLKQKIFAVIQSVQKNLKKPSSESIPEKDQ